MLACTSPHLSILSGFFLHGPALAQPDECCVKSRVIERISAGCRTNFEVGVTFCLDELR